MKACLKIKASLLAAFFFLQPQAFSAPQEFVIYTYDSILSKHGLGAAVFPLFEKKCGCKLRTVSSGNAGQILTRLELDRERGQPAADVVVGIDSTEFSPIEKFTEKWGAWTPRGSEKIVAELKGRVPQDFLPLDYGYFALMEDGKKLSPPPRSVRDLLGAPLKRAFILEDPRTSSPGLSFLLYTRAIGLGWDYWHALASQWLALAPGWDQAYGLFLAGEAPLVWSYTTSEAYHREHGDPNRYHAILFDEGQPLQVEGAVLVKNTPLARAFMEFLLSPEVQDRIPLTNWMYPAAPASKLPVSFQKLPKPKKVISLRFNPTEVKSILSQWNNTVAGLKIK